MTSPSAPQSSRKLVTKMITVLLPILLIYSLLSANPAHQSQALSTPKLESINPDDQLPSPIQSTSDIVSSASRTPSSTTSSNEQEQKSIPQINLTPKERQSLPQCARNGIRARSFLIIFMGHSGSSAILSELRQHSMVKIDDPEPVDHYEYEFNTTLALRYTRTFFDQAIAAGKTPGFKMRPNHIHNNPKAWSALIKQYNTRIIWQYRNNLVKQAVGEYSYRYLNDTSVVEGLRSEEEKKTRCKRGAGCRFSITNFEFFHKLLTDCIHSDLVIAKGVHEVSKHTDCVHSLPYENYLYRREESMKNLRNFLGLPHVLSKPSRYKATSDNLCDVVENWKELCQNFYGCHVWRHMFDDERNGCKCDFSSGHVNYCDTAYRGWKSK